MIDKVMKLLMDNLLDAKMYVVRLTGNNIYVYHSTSYADTIEEIDKVSVLTIIGDEVVRDLYNLTRGAKNL